MTKLFMLDGNVLDFVYVLLLFFVFGLELWCLMPLATIFELYSGGKFYCGENQGTRGKPPNIKKSFKF